MPRHPKDPLGLLSVAQAIPHDAVNVVLVGTPDNPVMAVMLENQDPRACADPRVACTVLAVSQHNSVLMNLDTLIGNMLMLVDVLMGKAQLTDIEKVTLKQHIDLVASSAKQVRENMAKHALQGMSPGGTPQ